MKRHKSRDGVSFVVLPMRFAVGFGYKCGMVKRFEAWRWDTYLWYHTYENGSWYFRVLWFYFGRLSEEGLREFKQRYSGRKHELSS